jgi:hypothetical protein
MSHDDAGLKSRGGRMTGKGGQHRPGLGRLTAATLNGALWFLGGAGLRIVLRVGVVAILARLLAPGDFGVIAWSPAR